MVRKVYRAINAYIGPVEILGSGEAAHVELLHIP